MLARTLVKLHLALVTGKPMDAASVADAHAYRLGLYLELPWNTGHWLDTPMVRVVENTSYDGCFDCARLNV